MPVEKMDPDFALIDFACFGLAVGKAIFIAKLGAVFAEIAKVGVDNAVIRAHENDFARLIRRDGMRNAELIQDIGQCIGKEIGRRTHCGWAGDAAPREAAVPLGT